MSENNRNHSWDGERATAWASQGDLKGMSGPSATQTLESTEGRHWGPGVPTFCELRGQLQTEGCPEWGVRPQGSLCCSAASSERLLAYPSQASRGTGMKNWSHTATSQSSVLSSQLQLGTKMHSPRLDCVWLHQHQVRILVLVFVKTLQTRSHQTKPKPSNIITAFNPSPNRIGQSYWRKENNF